MKIKVWKKFVSIILSLSLLTNSLFAPLIVLAQEISPSPTPTPTIAPTEEPSPSPEVSPSSEAVATPDASPSFTPTDEPAPISQDESVTTPTPDSAPTTPGPPEETEVLTETGSATPTITPLQPIEEGELSTTLVQEGESYPIEVLSYDGFTVTTDKLDYAPTDTAVITGTNFTSGETYTLTVSSSDEPATSTTVSVTADENGEFVYAYQLDGIYRPNYLVEVKEGETIVASTTFTDANPSANLDQCGNGPLSSPDPTPCQSGTEWENGNLGASKSHYYEGDTVPYRMLLDNLSLASHTLTIEWDTTKSGKHATDYLKTYNATVAADPCAGVSGCTGPGSTFAIPKDPQVDNGAGSPINQAAGNFTLFGGTITGVSAYSYPDGAGFTGDKSAQITITFTATQANPVLAWGGHISDRADWGEGNSAVSIPGSPYHMRNEGLDGSGGNQDRSLSANAVIFPASITIIKQASVEGSTPFSYTASPSPLSNFSLVDDGTSANTQPFLDIVDFQAYTVSETAPTGWSLDNIICSVTSANGGSQNVTNPSVEIDLKEGENVTCTFTNSIQNGHIIVDKVTDPSGESQSFDFVATGSGYVNFSLTDADIPNDQELTPGVYGVSETVPTGWDQTDVTCLDQNQEPENPAEINLSAGGTVYCTFTNTQRGSISGYKHEDLNGDGVDDGDWVPVEGWGIELWQDLVNLGSAFTDEDGFYSFTDLLFGTYQLKEVIETGWTSIFPTEIAVDLEAGENDEENNFVNTQYGNIVVEKQTDPDGSQQAFEFETDYGDNFFLSDGQQNDSGNLLPGTYSVDELTPDGWDQTNVTCSDQSDPSSISLQSNETVTCVFTNTQRGKISGKKFNDLDGDHIRTNTTTDPNLPGWTIRLDLDESATAPNCSEGTVNGEYCEDITNSFGNYSFPDLAPGTYIVSEVLQPGWAQTRPDDTYGGEGAQADGTYLLTLDAGEEIDDRDFGNRGALSILACKYEDSNGPLEGGTQAAVGGWSFTLGDVTQQTTENGCTLFENLTPGEYTVSELPLPEGWFIADDSQGSRNVVLTDRGQTVNFFNYRKATITVIKDVVDPDGNDVADDHQFTAQLNGGNDETLSESTSVDYEVNPGTYTVGELDDDEYTELGCQLPSGADATEFEVSSNEEITVTCTNQQEEANITVVKHVVGTDGSTDISDTSTYFTFHFEDNSPSLTDDEFFSDDVNPGEYFVSEDPDSNYDFLGCEAEYDGESIGIQVENGVFVTLGSGDSVTVTCTNGQKPGSINGTKWNDVDGNSEWDGEEEVLEGWTIFIDENDDGILDDNEDYIDTDEDGYYEFTDLDPGTYRVCEVVEPGWAQTYPLEPNCHDVTVGSNDTQRGYDFGNQGRGNITVIKDVVPGDDSEWFFDIYDDNDFFDQFSLPDEESTLEAYHNVAVGSWSISEEPSDLYTTTYDCGDKGSGDATSVNFELLVGDDVTCTFTNTRDTGTIIVHKIIDSDGNTETTDDQTPGEDWEIDVDGQEGDTSDPLAQNTDNNGEATFADLKTGDYNVSETLQNGYDLLDAYCDGGENGSADGVTIYTINVGADETVNCTFINSPNGSIHGQKWNDENGNGTRDNEEPFLGGWRIFLDENENQTWDEGEEYMLTDSGEELGWYWFEHLFPGTYTVCEELEDGWDQTSSPTCHTVQIPNGENTCTLPEQLNVVAGATCDFGNQESNLGVSIEKSNDKSGGASAGDTVKYTLVVTNTGGATIFGLDVVDFLPGGFSYVLGSTTGATTADPTVAGSKLTWSNVTDLSGGASITIEYQVKIASDATNGTYTNFATCSGDVRSQEDPIECNEDDSSVTIGSGTSFGGNLTPQVLGLATELPATGTPTIFLILSLGLLGIGTYLRKKYAK